MYYLIEVCFHTSVIINVEVRESEDFARTLFNTLEMMYPDCKVSLKKITHTAVTIF